jgi:hypothetical protein
MKDKVAALAGALALIVAAGCTAPSPSEAASSTPAASPGASGSPTTSPGTTPATADCPVTRPRPFEPPPGVSYEALFGADASHGNGQLWVGGLGSGGVVVVAEPDPDGSLSMKFGWYRVTAGRLTITGRRLDAPAPPARANVPDGYGDTGFQSTAVIFPTPGCWEITGTVGPTAITFVTLVTRG